MAKYIDIEPLEKDGWMLRRNTFTIDSATVELKHLRDFPTVEISDIITSDNEYMGSVVQGRWTPVTEGLPEERGRYLVTRGLNAWGSLWNRIYIANYSDLMGIKSERIWWQGNVGKSDFERLDDVLAWMPLPKPYKGR